MNKAFLLTKTQFTNLFNLKKGGKAKAFQGLSIVVSLAIFVALSINYNISLYTLFPKEQYDSVFLLMSSAVVGLTFILGVSYSQGMLFGFKDYDFLMSLPVSQKDIVVSKISTFLLLEYLYTFVIHIPTVVIYWRYSGCSFIQFLLGLLGTLFLPLLSIVISSLIGLFIKYISSGKKYEKLLQNLGTIVFLVFVFSLSFIVSDDNFTQQMTLLSGGFRQYLFHVNDYVNGVSHFNLIAYIRSAVISVLVMVGFIAYCSTWILKINALGKQGYHVTNFKVTDTRQKSPLQTLILREFRRYFSNFMYMMNSTIGVIMLWVFAIGLLLQPSFVDDLPIQDANRSFVIMAVFLVAGMICHTVNVNGSTISLEGKSLWILKTSPVSTKTILYSKVITHFLILFVPVLPAILLLLVALHGTPMDYLLGVLYVFLISLFMSVYCLVINLRFPKLDFDREIIVIKQSMATFFSLLPPLGLGIVTLALFIVFGYEKGYTGFLIILGCYFVVDCILLWLLNHWGQKAFEAL